MELARRDFVKGAAASAAGMAALSVAPALAEEEKAAPAAKRWSWEEPPAPIDDSQIVETIEVEVAVLGAGTSGVAAACSCAENGLQVAVFEKTTQANGRGGGVGACNSRLNKQLGYEIEPVAAQYRWNRTCGNRNNEALVKMWFDSTGPAMDWLLDKADKRGATYNIYAGYSASRIAPEEPDFHTFGAGNFEIPDGVSGFMPTALMFADCLDMGVPFYFEHRAEQLIKEGDRVVGAIVSSADGYKKVLASKAVILATGDIHQDPEMMDAYCEPMMKGVLRDEYTPAGAATGDGQKMGMWVGAVMQDGPLPIALHPQACAWFHGPFLFLNKNGKRFFNEANWVQAKSLQMLKQPGCYAYSIFDSNYGEDTKDSLNYGGGMFWDSMSRNVGQEFDHSMIDWAVNMAVGGGNGFKADTLEELADMLEEAGQVNKENMLASVERYNELCEKGVDDDFAKEPEFLYPIKEGPFYALKAGPAILVVVGGLRVNTDLQCIDKDENPIPGLYAVGNASGDLYAVDYPINMPGNSHGRCLAWGWLVGQKIAALE
ncbi:MAG: FAD-binding protein [Coriobacteriales bacterium]|nr:FAD-binding protein [Coriobacteriales bacterium]